MDQRHELGKKGEQLAVDFLIKKGYTIKERNWRFGYLEIDIIARKEDLISIIEVKTRSKNTFGSPESFVSKKKIKNLVQAANAYLEYENLTLEVQFDIVSIYAASNKVNHIINAFRWF